MKQTTLEKMAKRQEKLRDSAAEAQRLVDEKFPEKFRVVLVRNEIRVVPDSSVRSL